MVEKVATSWVRVATRPGVTPVPLRVSRIRVGLSIGVYPEPAGKNPATSATRSVATIEYRHTLPPAPNRTIARFGTV